MDQHRFGATYRESRNGTESFTRHPLVRRFIYSDGVKELAELGCYWLLDVIATEVVDKMRKNLAEYRGQVTVRVADGKAAIELTYRDDEPPVWSRTVDITDLQDGDWVFLIANDDGVGSSYSLILPTEY